MASALLETKKPLDAVGNVTALTTLNGNCSYGYDQAYQLTSESRTGLQAYSKSYSYDSEGNRETMVNGATTTNYTYNAADQLVSWSEGAKTCAYAYDREGNVIGKTLTDNGTTTDGWDFQYDAANRMDNAVQTAGGNQSLYNTYAGDGWQRVQAVNNGNTMRFGWNGDALLAEFDANGNLTAAYLNDGLDAPLYKTSFSNNGATVNGQEFYHQDANGRVHHLTDGKGNISEKYLYDAFGNQTILVPNNNVLNASAVGNRIGFQGREHDGMAGGSQLGGLQYFRHRFYEPSAGRWLNRHPWWDGPELNAYQFVTNNPMRFVDPYGLPGTRTEAVDRINHAVRELAYYGHL
jgi:RHS repeat-associated protein